MKPELLALGKDIEHFNYAKPYFMKLGLTPVLLQSMQEALEEITKNKNYIAIGINEDNINYLPQLKIMRDCTTVPIFIMTSNYDVDKLEKAILCGADDYMSWDSDIDICARRVIALAHRFSERSSQPKPLSYISRWNLLICMDYRQVFFDDAEIKLKRKEYDLLLYLMNNRGRVLTHDEILRNVWGEDYVDSNNDTVWTHISRLRKKLTPAKTALKIVENVYGVGYRFDI